MWWCLQGRGTQQGGSHSPTLFGRVLAGRFEQLSAQWTSRGEIPAFVTPLLAVWALWFIDDSIFLFRTVPQLRRLMLKCLPCWLLWVCLSTSPSRAFSGLLFLGPCLVCLARFPFKLLPSTWACRSSLLKGMPTWLIPCVLGPPLRTLPTDYC